MAHIKQFEHLKIQLEAIKSATNNFADETCIGKGGFGKVYKGEIVHSEGKSMVALKRLDRAFGQGDPEFWKEIMMLTRYKHKNIVSLLGFCDDSGEKILIYEFAPKKSLELYLDSSELKWVGRLKICIGAAHGLAYLHTAVGTQQRVLHRDIKSSNILLDENWNAKISDFGLSKFGPANQEFTFVFSNPVGTHGYCDPLYSETTLLTKESDVYSFGVVLFEVLSGRLCLDHKNTPNKLPPLVGLVKKAYEENKMNEIIYSDIKDEINPYSLMVFTKIAYQCLKRDREERPLMSDIVRELETALQYQMVTYLLKRGVDVNAINRKGYTALDVVESDASNSTALQIVPALLEVGAKRGDQLPSPTTRDILQITHSPRTKKPDSSPNQPNHHISKQIELQNEGLRNARNTITVVAVLIATVTFSAFISPPTGFSQESGKAKMAKNPSFKVFMVCNFMALFLSLGIVNIILFKMESMVNLLVATHKIMWVSTMFMAAGCIAATWNMVRVQEIELMVIVVGVGCTLIVLLGLGVLLGKQWSRKQEWRRRRVKKMKDGNAE